MIDDPKTYNFRAGHPKFGGRKSTEVKTHLRKVKRSVREFLDEINTNPIAELIKLARQKKTPIDIRAKCWAEVAKFAYPRLSTVAMHHSGDVNHEHRHVLDVVMANPELAAMAERLALAAAEVKPARQLQSPGDAIDISPVPDSIPCEEPSETPEAE